MEVVPLVLASRRITACACALALGFGVAGQASGAAGRDAGKTPQAGKDTPRLVVLERPSAHFDRSVRVYREHRRRARRQVSDGPASFAPPEQYGVSQSTLDAIAACESGGDPAAVSADGTYRGKYQFDYGTWSSVGGSGDPAAAPEAEQDMRAAMLYSQSGSSPWPICG
jgi:soluble lytic murein transglycosylase-like protein